MADIERLRALVEEVLPEVTEFRHVLHQNPELSMQEYETCERIRDGLATLNLDVAAPYLETDTVAMLAGKGPGRNVTLRADIDALPLKERGKQPYRSQNDGVMHACGHDGHAAILLGAAKVLCRLKNEFSGSVRFVFQPGEEVGGGRLLIEQGILDDPKPDAVFALHGWPSTGAGTIAAMPGVFMAAADFFKVRIIGKGAHASRPQDAIDPIKIGSKIIPALQEMMDGITADGTPAVLSITRFEAGTNSNVIPDDAVLQGTARYLDREVGDRIVEQFRSTITDICDSVGAKCQIDYDCPFIPTDNSPAIVELGKRITEEALGPDKWVELNKPSMGGEDFAYYITDYPGALFRLGLATGTAPLHNSQFDFSDSALHNGILFFVACALDVLEA